jgi:NTE family protein
MMRNRPDVLVLGGGGVLGAAWMTGLLAGIEDGTEIDLRTCEHFVGTSAGAIVAAALAAGESPRRPPATPANGVDAGVAGHDNRGSNDRAADAGAGAVVNPRVAHDHGQHRRVAIPARALSELSRATLRTTRRAGAWAVALSSPLAPVALRVGEPGGALTRSAILRLVPRPTGTLEELYRAVARIDAPFDGRLRVVAVRRDTGRRTVFGRPGAPNTTVVDAVLASCALPWMVAPVRIGEREYIDGGVWSPTNLDAAPAGRDTQVLCLNPTAGIHGPNPLIRIARGASRSRALVEMQALRARGARVRLIGPDAGSGEAIGSDLMDRTRREAVLAAGYRQGLTLTER